MEIEKTYRAILIAGPTASGKSALALDLAQRHNGIVVNADSMQVYRELCILSARPQQSDLEIVPHALYGHVSGENAYSVGRWLVDATAAIEGAWRDGRLPIVVGGTGLYFKALLDGLSPIPQIPGEVRTHWRREAERLGACALHRVLAARDPVVAARLKPTDTQRLTRAIEVLDATGRSLADWQSEAGRPLLGEADTLRYVLTPERWVVQERADRRLDAMIANGALEEVRTLGALGLSPDLPVMRAVGVRPLLAGVEGKMPLADAIVRAKLDTRQYIKRQETWLKRHMIAWKLY